MRAPQPEKEIHREAEPAGRYDPLLETEQEVRRAQHPGRYDELRDAEPPPAIVPQFEAEAARTTEPDPNPDRDAAEAQWLDQLVEASIASAAEQEARERAKGRAAEEGRGAAPTPPGEPETRAAPEDWRPLGKTGGDIRTAWTLTRTEEDLFDALAACGINLAVVSAGEARQSERSSDFADAVGNFSSVLREGEIVAVNDRGHVHRLTERNTGDARPEIEARLAGIDRAGLLDVADTKEALQEASRSAWIDQQRAGAEKGRPPTGIETKIAAALASTMTGYEFAETLDKAGLTITRVSASDVMALDAERSAAVLGELVDRVNDETGHPRHLARVAEGDFAAITRQGDVFRLSPHKLDFEEIDQRLLDTQPRLPGVVEARALHQLNREQTAELWDRHQAFNLERSMARLESSTALDDRRHATHELKDNIHDAREDLGEAGSKAVHAIGRGLMSAARAAFDFLESLFSPPPRLTKDQAERRELVAEEAEQRAAQHEHRTEEENTLSAINDQISEQNRERHQDFYTRFPGLTRRPDEPEPDRGRERERER
jgi:hypothetical protein